MQTCVHSHVALSRKYTRTHTHSLTHTHTTGRPPSSEQAPHIDTFSRNEFQQQLRQQQNQLKEEAQGWWWNKEQEGVQHQVRFFLSLSVCCPCVFVMCEVGEQQGQLQGTQHGKH